MEAAALDIAKSAVSAVLKTAVTAITDEVGLLLGVQEELFFIKEEFEMMQAFLRAASIGDAKGEVVTTWVKQVRELAFDVEDCLQEASVYLMKKGCLPATFSSKKRDHIARKIKSLKIRIEDVSKRNLRYGLIKNTSETTPELVATNVAANEEVLLVGLSERKQKLLQLIEKTHESLQVISVVGMGGLGKTTLVKHVYSCPELRSKFECFAWVNLLHPFNEKEFFGSLARQLSPVDHEEDEKKGVLRQLSQVNHRMFKKEDQEKNNTITKQLEEKKCVIVLDDLANEIEWRKIKNVFPKDIKASLIIVTTRSESLAKCISGPSENIYKTPDLSREDSIDLFYSIVFRGSGYTRSIDGRKSNGNPPESSSSKNNDDRTLYRSKSLSSGNGKSKQNKLHTSSSVPSEIQEMASTTEVSNASLKKMVKPSVTEEMEKQAGNIIDKCGGLPLAIVMVGSYLAIGLKSSAEWKAFCDHLTSEIDTNPNLEKIKTVLMTSFVGLPYHLKSCFLYLCVFHNHQEIRRSRIVRRWMAEGLIINSRDMTAEEIGDRYFNDLMSRSLIQPPEVTTIGVDTVTRCKIHDLIYEMLVTKTENENVISLVGDQTWTFMNGRARHVVIKDWKEKRSIVANMKLSHVRSVTAFGKVESSITYHKMRLLRVLDLEGTLDLKDRHLKRIGKLRHLKYLGLRNTIITKLPDSLEKLHDLETIDVRNTWVRGLPMGIVKLQKLSYLRAGFNFYNGNINDVPTRTVFNPVMCFKSTACVALCWPFLCLFGIKNYSRPWTHRCQFKDLVFFFILCSCICCISCEYTPIYEINTSTPFGVKMPRGIDKLRSLHNLGTVDIGQSNGFTKELRCLTNLRKLAITGFSKKNGEQLAEAIGELTHLRSLVLSASDNEGLSYCLSYFQKKSVLTSKKKKSVLYPPKYLQSLKLFSPIDELPSWIGSLDSLVKIHLRNTKLKDFGVLGQLPNLKIFYILENSCDFGELRFVPNTFQMLQVMFLDGGESLDKVSIEKTALKSLVHLKIRNHWFQLSGLQSLLSLKEVVLMKVNSEIMKNVEEMILMNPNKPIIR